MKKDKNPRAPQVGDNIMYKGTIYEVYTIDPDKNTFSIDISGRPLELSGDDWDIYI